MMDICNNILTQYLISKNYVFQIPLLLKISMQHSLDLFRVPIPGLVQITSVFIVWYRMSCMSIWTGSEMQYITFENSANP